MSLHPRPAESEAPRSSYKESKKGRFAVLDTASKILLKSAKEGDIRSKWEVCGCPRAVALSRFTLHSALTFLCDCVSMKSAARTPSAFVNRVKCTLLAHSLITACMHAKIRAQENERELQQRKQQLQADDKEFFSKADEDRYSADLVCTKSPSAATSVD